MVAEQHLLKFATLPDPDRRTGDRVQLVHGSASGAALRTPAGNWSLWLPLRNELEMQCALGRWRLPQRHLLVTRDAVHGRALTTGAWLALTGSQSAWNSLLRAAASHPAGWLPWQSRGPDRIIRRFVGLARLLRDDRDLESCEAATRALCSALLEQQLELEPLLARCNGRTPERRRLTLQRLLRVHQLIERDSDSHLDLTTLSRVASYSPWHLIRMYRDVFGETPSEHVARLRLARAWSMVRESALPVCEITEKLGFESQSAFCRAFKNAYGLTTTQARGLAVAVPRQLSRRPARVRRRSEPAQPLPIARLR